MKSICSSVVGRHMLVYIQWKALVPHRFRNKARWKLHAKYMCGGRHKKNKFREQVAQGWMSSAKVHKYIVVGLHRLLTQSRFLDDMTSSFCERRCECFKTFKMWWHWLPAPPKDSKWLNFEGCADCTHLYVTELWQMWMFSGLPVTLITVPKGALGR